MQKSYHCNCAANLFSIANRSGVLRQTKDSITTSGWRLVIVVVWVHSQTTVDKRKKHRVRRPEKRVI